MLRQRGDIDGEPVLALWRGDRHDAPDARLSGRGAQVLEVDTEGNGGVTRMRITPQP